MAWSRLVVSSALAKLTAGSSKTVAPSSSRSCFKLRACSLLRVITTRLPASGWFRLMRRIASVDLHSRSYGSPTVFSYQEFVRALRDQILGQFLSDYLGSVRCAGTFSMQTLRAIAREHHNF